MTTYTLPLSDPQASLETAGGKGASLAKLAQAGLPVPGGFHVTTAAYQQFVAANRLQPQILKALSTTDAADPAALEAASQAVSALFAAAEMPAEIAAAVRAAYAALGSQSPVAVRSSATAEDLPEASFAGQQETYLNICGAEAVLGAVQKCWASLWTARAIAYRLRQGIPPESVALAVVVQRLVPAEAAGILFTANPLNGRRGELVINAAWGLGEAIVGGLVTPDTLTLDKAAGKLLKRETAEKQVMTVRSPSGTQEQPVPDRLKRKPVLSDRQAVRLARLGAQVETLYGMPMDIEWALAGGRFVLLQARPITALGEAPLEWKLPLPDGVYMRTSIVDLLPDPLSPLYATLGVPALVAQTYPIGRFLTRMEPVLPEGYFTTINTYAYMNAHFKPRAWWWIIFGMLVAYPRILRMSVAFWREQARPHYQQAVSQAAALRPAALSAGELWQAVTELMDAAAFYTATLMFATMGASAGSEGLLTKLYDKFARRADDPPAAALLMGWDSLPIRAEKSLYDLAQLCRAEESLTGHVLETPAEQLANQLEGEAAPQGVAAEAWAEFRQRFTQHLEDFGYMIFELDFAKALPRDHPEPMLELIKMYLRGEGSSPHERQQASQAKRLQTAEAALARLKGLRRWAFSKSLNWAQSLSAVREDALAEIGLGYPALRRLLGQLGARLVKAGALQEAGDIFWMEKEEVAQAAAALDAGTAPQNMQERVAQRKAFCQKMKQTVPPPMLPMKKKYLGFDTSIWLAESDESQGAGTLKGVPASPGQATAPACVLHGPQDFARMRPGGVLVAGTTTPAWTPLFAMASAVVTDIGGPLSHGSIVAREYGIPAVMGTGVATRRIRDGQTITVDGGAGTVTLQEQTQ